MREYRYLAAEGITFGVDVREGYARVAMAACNDIDTYCPETGKDIVDLLFDKNDNTLRACALKRNVVRFPYKGDKPRRDVLKGLVDFIGDELGERGFFRALKSYYESGVVCNKDAVEASRELEDENIYLDFARMMENLDENEQIIFAGLESEEELYQFFFPWEATTGFLFKRMKAFASAVWTEELVLGAEKPEKKMAPRKPNPEKVFVAEEEEEEEETSSRSQLTTLLRESKDAVTADNG